MTNTKTFFFVSLIVGAVFSVGLTVSAHGSGASFVATTTPYVIDVGYDAVPIVAGQAVRFDFLLTNEKTGKPVPFSQVWVRIGDAEHTVLATGVFRQSFGPTTLLYSFASVGDYKLQASYRDANGDVIAESSFSIPVVVDPYKERSWLPYATSAGLLIAGFVLGVLGMYIWHRRT